MSFNFSKNDLTARLLNPSLDFTTAVALGLIPGIYPIDKFGENSDIDIDDTPEDVTMLGGTYTFSDASDIGVLSSTSALDVGISIKLSGIEDPETSDGEKIGYASLNGQSKVFIYDNPELTGTPFTYWRVHTMQVLDETEPVGTVWCYVDGTITNGTPDDLETLRASIDPGENRTLLSIYTIPPKKVGLLLNFDIDVSRTTNSGTVQGALRIRPYEKVFQTKRKFNLQISGTSSRKTDRRVPLVVAGLSDIKITIEAVSANNSEIVANFELLVVNEEFLDDSFLSSIGQPGF